MSSQHAAERRPAERALSLALPALCVAAWWLAQREIDIRSVGDFGLATTEWWPAIAALAVLIVSLALTLRHGRPDGLAIVVHLAALVVVVYAATVPFDESYRFPIVWRHAGIADHILSTGDVDPKIDAYFNWPAFFMLTALATELSGLGSSLEFSNWAPVVLNLLYLPPLVVIGRAVLADRRLVWAGIAVFYLTNWVGQDYLSPQGLGLFTYLAVIATLLVWFPAERIAEPLASHRRAALMAALVACIAVEAASHQLTPFAILLAVASLVLAGRCSARGLPLLTGVLIAVWVSYMTTEYLSGNLADLAGQVGRLGDTVNSNVGERVAGSDEHRTIVLLRLASGALVWLLAVAGALRLRRRGQLDRRLWVLAAVPFAMAVLQPYGGEIILRVYLFSLPFAALLAAAALWPRTDGHLHPLSVAGIAAGGLALVALLGFTRYGNERVNLFTREEVSAVSEVYDVAPRGSLLLAASPNLPWQFRDYATYDYRVLTRAELEVPESADPLGSLADAVAGFMADSSDAPAFLILTRSQRNYDQLLGSPTWGSVPELERAVARSVRFTGVIRSRDATVYRLVRLPFFPPLP